MLKVGSANRVQQASGRWIHTRIDCVGMSWSRVHYIKA